MLYLVDVISNNNFNITYLFTQSAYEVYKKKLYDLGLIPLEQKKNNKIIEVKEYKKVGD